jgi:HEAT repeat protein
MFGRSARLTAALLAVAMLICVGPAIGAEAAKPAPDKAALDKAFADLPKYDWGQAREPLNVIDEAVVATYGDAAARKDLEARLCAVLKGEATRAAKQYVCRKLALVGTAGCVEALAPLLEDKDLSHMARYVLERMTDPAAGKALRDSLAKATGKVKVGIINSLGMRQDAESTAALVALLKDSDAEVAVAAAAALGRIGAKEAAAPLAEFLASASKEIKFAAIDASLDLAGGLAKKGDKDEAAKIYQKLYAPDQTAGVRRAALQGLAMVKPAETTAEILKALSSEDATFRGLAVSMIKEMPGAEVTKAFAAELPKLPAAGQVGLLDALEARKDPAAREAVLAAAGSDKPEVKAAALRALGAVGGAADVPMLAKTAAAEAATDPGKAARESLARLRGEDINKAVVAALEAGDAKVKVELLGVLAARAASETAPAAAKLAGDADDAVRRAAIEALGALGDEKQVAPLVAMAKAPKDPKDRPTIEKALIEVCGRVRDKAVEDITAGLAGSDADAHVLLLNALGRAGGAKALAAVVADTKSADAPVKDGAIRVLSNWPDNAALKELLALAAASENKAHQVLAIRGAVRLARVRETPDKQKLDALGECMKLAKDPAEKKQVLGALGEINTPESLKMIAPCLDDKDLAEEAASAAVKVADRLDTKKEGDLLRDTMTKALEVAKNNQTKKTAEKVLGKLGAKAAPKPQ